MVFVSFGRGHLRVLSCFPLLYILLLSLLGCTATANMMLIGNNVTLSFDDIEANFAPTIKGPGQWGVLYLAEPLDACSRLTNEVVMGEGPSSPFALIIRGGCPFDDKVRTAQDAGFKAAVIFNNEDGGVLVAMAGNPAGIKIPAVFVSKTSGEVLRKYAGVADLDLWIIPTFENSAWSIMAISFISLLAMSAVLATCFFVRRHHIRRERPRASRVREFHGMSSRMVKAMPSLIFTSVLEDNCTSGTCAICLEDYNVGEKLRILPCRHKFHAFCVDSWLTTWRTFCPICKRDARTLTGNAPASECTPLLSPASTSSSVALSSAHSSLPSSSAIQIGLPNQSSTGLSSAHSLLTPSPSIRITPSYQSTALSSAHSSLATSSAMRIASSYFNSPSMLHSHSLSNTPYLQPREAYSNQPAISVSRSSIDLRNAASPYRSPISHLVSPYSLGFPSLTSPLNSQYASPFRPSSSYGSPAYLGSPSRQQFLHHRSDSATSISPLASAQSLPGC